MKLKRFLMVFSLEASSIKNEVKIFAEFLEQQYFPKALQEGFEDVEWEIKSNPYNLEIISGPKEKEIPSTPYLSNFLTSLGIKKMVLSVRLESNQITDIIQFLWGIRGALKNLNTSKEAVRNLIPEYCTIIVQNSGIMVDCVGHGLFSALIAAAIKAVFLNIQSAQIKPIELQIST